MKICFLLQRRFAYIGHNLAVLLKEKYGITEFCGYVYLRSSYDFLKQQSFFTNLLPDSYYAKYADLIRVISLPQVTQGRFAEAVFDGKKDKGLLYIKD